MNFNECFSLLRSAISNVSLEADSEIEVIFERVFNEKFLKIKAFKKNFTTEEVESLLKITEKRSLGEPLSYIFQSSSFYGRDFSINKDCLIPRFDSESLVENLLFACKDFNKKDISIIDICSGSGCLGISFCAELLKTKNVNLSLTFLEKSKNAMLKSLENAKNILKNNVKINEKCVDLFDDNVELERYDVIISNPPYIKSLEIENLEKQVKDFEPIMALDGGIDGLLFYQKIAKILPNVSTEKSVLGIEFGFDQSNQVVKIFKNRLVKYTIFKDLGKNERGLIGFFS